MLFLSRQLNSRPLVFRLRSHEVDPNSLDSCSCRLSFLVWQMDSIHRELAEKTVPRFDILRFEIPPTLEYSQDLFQSIESNGVSEEVRQSLRWDYLFIPTYVLLIILVWVLLHWHRPWIRKRIILIVWLTVLAGIFDIFENLSLEQCLDNWEGKKIRSASLFASLKFSILILAAIGPWLISGWFVLRKLFSSHEGQ